MSSSMLVPLAWNSCSFTSVSESEKDEAMAFERLPEFTVVVYSAAEGNDERSIRNMHGLRCALKNVGNSEAACVHVVVDQSWPLFNS
jgi:hypothetical protein